jgi:hypothetical protein
MKHEALLSVPSFPSRERRDCFLPERRRKMFKIGTVAELMAFDLEEKIPKEVYREAFNIVTMLDELFEASRDVEFDDGGFVIIAESKEDLNWFAQNCVELESPSLEYVEIVHSDKEPYLNVFFLVNEYEQGVTLFVPVSIAPERFLREAEARAEHR